MSILKEFRCDNCNKLFFKGSLEHCTIEIKCKNCKQFSTIEGTNCKLMLSVKDKGNHDPKDLKVLKSLDIKDAVLQCDACVEKGDCHCRESLKNNICPLCNKKVSD